MHKDQARVKDTFLPHLMDRIISNDAAAVLDCTLLNRLCLQGPDPLFIMETCPDAFRQICHRVGLAEAEGRAAVEAAHTKGPGVLLDSGTGIDPDVVITDMVPLSLSARQEILWLLLASCSDCTEGGYQASTSLAERIRRAVGSCTRFTALTAYDSLVLAGKACTAAGRFFCGYTQDPRFDVPLFTEDIGFYVGFKMGFKVVAVQAGNNTFYGTSGTTTLADHGIVVDKALSPTFGIVFNT